MAPAGKDVPAVAGRRGRAPGFRPVAMIKVACLSFLGTMAVSLLVTGGAGVGPTSVRFWNGATTPPAVGNDSTGTGTDIGTDDRRAAQPAAPVAPTSTTTHPRPAPKASVVTTHSRASVAARTTTTMQPPPPARTSTPPATGPMSEPVMPESPVTPEPPVTSSAATADPPPPTSAPTVPAPDPTVTGDPGPGPT